MSEVTNIARAWNDRPVYTRATILGLVLIALATLMVLIVQPIEGNSKSLAFSIPIFLIPLVVVTLVWKYESWLLIVAAVTGALGLVNAVPFLDYGISNPHSFFDFIPNVLNIVGALIALGAGVTAYIRDRRGDSRTLATGTEMVVTLGIAMALVSLVVFSIIATATQRATVSAEDRQQALTIDMKDFEFKPGNITLSAGAVFQAVIKNRDILLHTFTINDLDIDYEVGPDSEILVKLGPPESGTYEFTCEVPGHEDMKGTLVVR